MKKPVLVGVVFVLVILAVIVYSTMNLAKYKALPQKTRDFLDQHALAYEQQNDFWKSYNQNEAKRQAEAGIQVITFDAATNKTYVEKANEVGWAAAIKSSPQYGEALKKVLAK